MTASLKLPDDQQFITVQELKEKGFSQYKINKMVDDGLLKKLTRKAYTIVDYQGKESEYCLVNAYVPNGVVCLLSAAAYYNLTTFIPDAVNVAIPRQSHVSTLPSKPRVCISYFTDKRYKTGVNVVREGNNRFKIYDIEKTVVDIIYYREKMGIEETKEILTNYLQRQDRKLNQIIRYAQQLKCEGIIRQYLEVLV